ncbi:MAG: hypothetical protein A3A44_03395 [Candidatus Sungbacteria bacterium RIFCSPLOWO2_01_FULL_60_25]|uniref:GGDEF domain-containing protein n=2 Tax=Candidatus Sungiibacteriota TaxID=1817917 RepID=A0A1G2LER0_9BACT|nr:MAG: hypothetical protein A3C16_03155 [Candidatus Sungbacteria bacterium RIFCSPHIGHO2_02_FULL_51_29]OHA09321.1 MAG: hypothetical protein A3A44_03395 [Candidatus Sungbacteria bacterium RIFCSPLOWO2_01_FULL_60_25]
MEGLVLRLFEEKKYEHGFPPRENALAVKSEFATRGLSHSSMVVQQLVGVYLKVAESVLEEFTEAVVDNRDALGIGSDEELRALVNDGHRTMFGEAGAAVLAELGGLAGEYRQLAMETVDNRRGPVWAHLERKIDLTKLRRIAPLINDKEREQKFGILLSPTQAGRDFEVWVKEAQAAGNPIALLFVDLDEFKALNARLTETKVDQTILPEVQRLLLRLVQGRGEAYRQGGEEFVMILRNLDIDEARRFGEKVRAAFEGELLEAGGTRERVTVSIGVAVWPEHGASYEAVLAAANRAEAEAKKTRNSVKVAAAQ